MATTRRRRPNQTTTTSTRTTSSVPAEGKGDVQRLRETLWGGPEGEGLVHTVAKLSVIVATHEKMILTKADIVHGDDGEPISLRRVFDEIQSFKLLVTRALWGLAVIGLGTCIVVGRSLQIAYQGHL